MLRNPFHYLYVGERVSAEEFTDIFSTTLVEHALPLFQPGHVVLSGPNGMGKSMLFNLFDPAVRIAYQKAGKPFPVTGEEGRFVAAGINVNTARCNEFGNRRTPVGDHVQELMFGDFFNYYVVLDVLRSVRTLGENDQIAAELGIGTDATAWAAAAGAIGQDAAWQGYLQDVQGLDQLRETLEGRIHRYRRFMNGNDLELDPAVASTKTSAGEPIKAAVSHLRQHGILPPDLPFYVLVDQYEELATITNADNRKADYRSVVNKVLNRDPAISYRIGTRGYGWRDHIHVFGTDARLEQERDYKLVELQALLRRFENTRTSIFNAFARDVFDRRIIHAAKGETGVAPNLTIASVFGKSMAPTDEAKILAGERPETRRTILEIDPQWPVAVKSYLYQLAEVDPLSARLGEAWIRQKGFGGVADGAPPPWESKPYWRKERNEVALLQIAGRRRERAVLCGEDDILGLSGGNILIFLSICQLIWDFASQASRRDDKQPEIPISREIQTVGIVRAARAWIDRIPTEYGRSDDRSRLVHKLGEKFADLLLPDRQMSNPGQNGISISVDELESRPDLKGFLVEAVDYGNLVMSEHANRSGRARRRKFYLNPLYCPVFRIPYQRTKEPLYLPIAILEDWLSEAGIIEKIARTAKTRRLPSSTPLFDMLEDDE